MQTVARAVEAGAATATTSHSLTTIVAAAGGADVPGGALLSDFITAPLRFEPVLVAVAPTAAAIVVLERSARTEDTAAAKALTARADGRLVVVGRAGFSGEADGAVWLVDLVA